ncbi:putative transposase [Xylophilus ampelinus]|uniref:Putative transposase n=2 Tax=Xylophilus ampelinus TaxID=54067 RepID=A0A318SIR8_9BURK|nr:putative transposase [Xylophilus ampelinus]
MLCGNDGAVIFRDDADRAFMVRLLADHAAAFGIAVHAYTLLDHRLQLLVTPEGVESKLSGWMQAVGRRYVRYFNDRHGRTGTLWEGRYRATVVEAARYLLPCMVAIDLAPVHVQLAIRPADHAWSSHRHWIGQVQARWLKPHPMVWDLGNTPFAREAAYAALVDAGLSAADRERIETDTLRGWAMGSPEFTSALQARTLRRVTRARAGRPPGRPSASPE